MDRNQAFTEEAQGMDRYQEDLYQQHHSPF